MVKIKYSLHTEAVRSRIKRLPKLVNDAMDAQTRKDVINVIKEYRKGLLANNFRLEPLRPVTIDNKMSKGYDKPRLPLYGAGENEPNSLYNALSFRKIKKGYRLYRRRAKHHESDLPLNVLLSIHEQGALIRVTERMRAFLHYVNIHLRPDTKIIRIPPRPVVDKAIIRALRKKKEGEPSTSVNKAIQELINTGKENMFNKLMNVPEGVD